MKTDKLFTTKQRVITIMAYAFSLLALVPIIRYLLVYKVDLFPEWGDKYVWARVVFSGPALIVIGIYLAVKFKSSIHGAIGIILSLLGIIWLASVGFTIYNEAA
jgi:hypothetical protein